MNGRHISARAFLLVGALGSCPAFAQAPNGGDTAAAAASNDIVVTARRREERLQDIPLAVTALNTEKLQEAGVTRLDDLQRAVPALQMQASTAGRAVPTFTIRAQRSSNTTLTLENSVQVYVAETVQARSHGLNYGMFDIANIQVLKGPQGTLFGRNSTGGALVITPQAPTDTWEGYGRLTLGNYNQVTAEGAANIPMTDKLQIRLGGQVSRNKGYTRNLFTGQRLDNTHYQAWRASIRYAPVEGLTNTLVVWGHEADERGAGARARFIGPPATTTFPGAVQSLARAQAAGFHDVYNTPGDAAQSHSINVANITEWKVSPTATVKNIFGYRRVRAYTAIDQDGLEQPIFLFAGNVADQHWSDELQLVGTAFDRKLDYILGAYYFREKGTENERNLRNNLQSDTLGDVVNKSKSLFAQATLRVPGLEALSLTGGLRYTWDSRALIQRSTTGTAGACALTGAAGAVISPCRRELQRDFKRLTYTLAVDYKFARDVMVYATHRKGYRAGGFNLRAAALSLQTGYKPEDVKDYEVGLKSRFEIEPDVYLGFNIAAYSQDYRNIQRNRGLISDQGIYLGATVLNAARASIKGLEPELRLEIGNNWEFSAYYAYTNSKYKEYQNVNSAGRVLDLSPSKFSGSPVHSGGATAVWKLPLANDAGTIRVVGNIYAQSLTYGIETNYDPVLGPLVSGLMPGYTVANARIEWNDVKKSGVSAALWVRNLNNEKYYLGAVDVLQGLGTSMVTMGDPRTFGIEVTARW